MSQHISNSKKIFSGAGEALAGLHDGMSIMSGGFGLCGIPENSIAQLSKMGLKNLCVISNNIGNAGRGLALLLKNRQISKAICSYVGGNPDLEQQILEKCVEVELVPQGTFAERIRAAGMGIRAFYTPAGHGTLVAEGKEERMFDKPCLLEYPLHADAAIIKAQKGDPYGNLWFKESAQNFSPLMAMATRLTIVEVEELVQLGDIPPENVHVPGVFVKRIYQGSAYKNDIEYKIVQAGDGRPDSPIPTIPGTSP